ncbi:type II secretion system protein GspM [Myxococcota bacterium]|nr:type II secretion system protein GspM [Myxococcota bacterium]
MADVQALTDKLLTRLEPVMEPLERTWSRLSRRDRALLAGMVLLLLSLVLWFGAGAMRSSLDRLETQVAARQKDLATVAEMKALLAESRGKVERMEEELRSQGDFSLAGYLEQSAGVPISAINDGGTNQGEFFEEQRVNIVVRNVTLEQLVELLYRLKTAPRHMRVTDLKVKTNFRSREQLDVNLEVTVYGPLPAAAAAEGDRQG